MALARGLKRIFEVDCQQLLRQADGWTGLGCAVLHAPKLFDCVLSCEGRGTDILLGANPKGLTLSVLEFILARDVLQGDLASSSCNLLLFPLLLSSQWRELRYSVCS